MSFDTPCVRICRQDRQLGFCLGCGRTIQEVFTWSEMSDQERTAISSSLAERLASVPKDKRLDR